MTNLYIVATGLARDKSEGDTAAFFCGVNHPFGTHPWPRGQNRRAAERPPGTAYRPTADRAGMGQRPTDL